MSQNPDQNSDKPSSHKMKNYWPCIAVTNFVTSINNFHSNIKI